MTARISDGPGYRILMWLIHEVLQLLTGYIAVMFSKVQGGSGGVEEQMNEGQINNVSRLPNPTCPRNLREIQTNFTGRSQWEQTDVRFNWIHTCVDNTTRIRDLGWTTQLTVTVMQLPLKSEALCFIYIMQNPSNMNYSNKF